MSVIGPTSSVAIRRRGHVPFHFEKWMGTGEHRRSHKVSHPYDP